MPEAPESHLNSQTQETQAQSEKQVTDNDLNDLTKAMQFSDEQLDKAASEKDKQVAEMSESLAKKQKKFNIGYYIGVAATVTLTAVSIAVPLVGAAAVAIGACAVGVGLATGAAKVAFDKFRLAVKDEILEKKEQRDYAKIAKNLKKEIKEAKGKSPEEIEKKKAEIKEKMATIKEMREERTKRHKKRNAFMMAVSVASAAVFAVSTAVAATVSLVKHVATATMAATKLVYTYFNAKTSHSNYKDVVKSSQAEKFINKAAGMSEQQAEETQEIRIENAKLGMIAKVKRWYQNKFHKEKDALEPNEPNKQAETNITTEAKAQISNHTPFKDKETSLIQNTNQIDLTKNSIDSQIAPPINVNIDTTNLTTSIESSIGAKEATPQAKEVKTSIAQTIEAKDVTPQDTGFKTPLDSTTPQIVEIKATTTQITETKASSASSIEVQTTTTKAKVEIMPSQETGISDKLVKQKEGLKQYQPGIKSVVQNMQEKAFGGAHIAHPAKAGKAPHTISAKLENASKGRQL